MNKNQLPPSLDDPFLRKALNVLMNFEAEEREAYEGHVKWLRIEMNTLKKSKAKGFELGLQEGIQKGKQKGRQEGLQEGRREERVEIALTLLQQRFSIEQRKRSLAFPKKIFGSNI